MDNVSLLPSKSHSKPLHHFDNNTPAGVTHRARTLSLSQAAPPTASTAICLWAGVAVPWNTVGSPALGPRPCPAFLWPGTWWSPGRPSPLLGPSWAALRCWPSLWLRSRGGRGPGLSQRRPPWLQCPLQKFYDMGMAWLWVWERDSKGCLRVLVLGVSSLWPESSPVGTGQIQSAVAGGCVKGVWNETGGSILVNKCGPPSNTTLTCQLQHQKPKIKLLWKS